MVLYDAGLSKTGAISEYRTKTPSSLQIENKAWKIPQNFTPLKWTSILSSCTWSYILVRSTRKFPSSATTKARLPYTKGFGFRLNISLLTFLVLLGIMGQLGSRGSHNLKRHHNPNSEALRPREVTKSLPGRRWLRHSNTASSKPKKAPNRRWKWQGS